jgi:hypothetical protein
MAVSGISSILVRDLFYAAFIPVRNRLVAALGIVRLLFGCSSGVTRRTPEANPKNTRRIPEEVPKQTKPNTEASSNQGRRSKVIRRNTAPKTAKNRLLVKHRRGYGLITRLLLCCRILVNKKRGLFVHDLTSRPPRRTEREMALCKIIEEDDDGGGGYLCPGGVPVKALHEDLEYNIVDQHAAEDHHEITGELHLSFQIRALEDHIHTQVEANGESKQEGDEQGCIVRFQGDKTQVNHLFLDEEIEAEGINQETQQSIASATGGIVIGLQGHETPEKRVKYIQDGEDRFSYFIVYPSHESCENSSYYSSLSIEFVKDG